MNSRLLKNNLSLKIISVVVAIILWLYAVSELNPETTKTFNDIPIEIINMNVLNEKNLTLAENPEQSITVRIRGLANDIRKVNISNLKAVLDLSEIDWTGTQSVALDIEGLLPREVKLDRIPEIPVTVNNITRKLIPVVVEWTGEGEDGYRIHDPVVEPRNITIYGAESLVNRVVQGVVQLNLDKDVGTIEQSILIKLVDAEGNIVESNYLNMRQSSALVTIPIYPIKSIAVRANVIGEPAEGFIVDNISVNPSMIEVNGYSSIIDRLNSLSTEVVDIRGAVDDVQTTVGLILENGIYLEPGQAPEVKVTVSISETVINNTLTLEEIDILNIPEGYGATVDNTSTSILLRGPYTIINDITVQDITSAVDLSQIPVGELQAGQYQLPLIIRVPEQVEVINISNETITVDVQVIEEQTTDEQTE